jgi:hypothetical protein
VTSSRYTAHTYFLPDNLSSRNNIQPVHLRSTLCPGSRGLRIHMLHSPSRFCIFVPGFHGQYNLSTVHTIISGCPGSCDGSSVSPVYSFSSTAQLAAESRLPYSAHGAHIVTCLGNQNYKHRTPDRGRNMDEWTENGPLEKIGILDESLFDAGLLRTIVDSGAYH